MYVTMPEKKIPVCTEVDLCVVGGSATGLFAAVRAARLGLRVALIEKNGCLGGCATSGLVNIWHSLYDTEQKNQIIAGLTCEVVDRLRRLGMVESKRGPKDCCIFHVDELKYQLDELARTAGIHLYLHSFYAGLETDGQKVTAVVMCGKDGLRGNCV